MKRCIQVPHRRLIRLLSLLLAAWWITALSACQKTESPDFLSYQTQPFHATLRGELPVVALQDAGGRLAFEAELHHTVATDTAGEDALTLTFTAPAALAGITLKKTATATTLSLEDISVDIGGWQRGSWDVLPSLFSLQGTSQITKGEGNADTVIIIRTDGGATVTLTLHAASGLPQRIECGEIWVEVLSFACEP